MGNYIGNSPELGPARIIEGSGTGDGTTVTFSMGFNVSSDKDVLVFIDGVKQDTSAYGVAGSNCVFSTAPINGENIDFVGYEVGKSVIPQDGSVGSDKINTASIEVVAQTVRLDDGDVATGSANFPIDDTIPQNTEGDEYMTVSITPTSATNKLIIEAQSFIGASGPAYMTMALFQDSIADSLIAIGGMIEGANHLTTMYINHEMVAGTLLPITFRIRAGADSGTAYFNGRNATRQYGGVMNSYIKVTEILQ